MMRSNIPLPPKLETKRNLAENWKIWKQIWESYEIVSNLVKQEDIYRVATFITCIGANALEIYNGLLFESEAHRKNMAKIMELMEKHCIGTTNVTYERYKFNNQNQEQGESIDTYVSHLRTIRRRPANLARSKTIC